MSRPNSNTEISNSILGETFTAWIYTHPAAGNPSAVSSVSGRLTLPKKGSVFWGNHDAIGVYGCFVCLLGVRELGGEPIALSAGGAVLERNDSGFLSGVGKCRREGEFPGEKSTAFFKGTAAKKEGSPNGDSLFKKRK